MKSTAVDRSFSLINPGSLTPLKVIFATCLIWLIFYVFAPIKLYAAESDYPYLLLGLCIGGLLLGLTVFEPREQCHVSADRDEMLRTLRRLYEIAFILAALGVAMRLADWVFLRGLTIDTEFMENREKIESAGSNALSMLSSVLVPFCLVPYMMHAVAKRNGMRVGSSLMSIGLATLWPLLTIVIGSRSSMFMSLGMLVLSRLIIFPRTSKKIVLLCALMAIGLIYIGGLIFIARLEDIGLRVENVIKLSAFTHLAPVTQEYFNIRSGLSDWGRDTLFIITTFIQYYTHGAPEFTYLVEHYNNGLQYGGYTFGIFSRLAHTLWGIPYDGNAVVMLTPRPGIYTTMFGPFYVDFGPFAPLFCIALGGLVSWTRRCVLRGEIAALPLYICFLMQVASSVIINAIQSAYGIFYNLAFIALWITVAVVRRRPSKVCSQAFA
ncbi:oligosaccharide repeat unit polymerase [Inquilinus limosus]|uniref:O-antigen polymerase n=1 Tax=Inquilinus limosus TaxID=171674 RepID=UPI003F177DCC